MEDVGFGLCRIRDPGILVRGGGNPRAMHDLTAQQASRRMRRWIMIVVITLLIAVGAFAVFRIIAHQRVASRLAHIRAAGYPTTSEELNAWYPEPEGENAADVYQRAFAEYALDTESHPSIPFIDPAAEVPALGEPLPQRTEAPVRHFLALNAEAIRLLEQAASIDESRFPVDYKKGLEWENPALGPLRQGARLLLLESAFNPGRAGTNIKIVLAMARSLEREPSLIAALVSISLNAVALEMIERAIAFDAIEDIDLVAVAHDLSRIDQQMMLHRALIGERALGVSVIAQTLTGRPSVARLWRGSGLFDLDRAAFLDILERHIDHLVRSDVQALATNALLEEVPRAFFLTQILTPALDRALITGVRLDASIRATLAGLAVHRYRRDRDEFPQSLDACVPVYLDAVPIDPFAERTLRYRALEREALIYSVGKDGVDNNGARTNGIVSGDPDTDIVFIVQRLSSQN